MLKYLNPKRYYYAVGPRRFFEFIVFTIFMIFFYFPLLNMVMLAFANEYQVPAVIPQVFGFKQWAYVLSRNNLVSSIVLSLIVALTTTGLSMLICIPAAYAIARFKFPGRRIFLLSFLLTNAFPKIGIYTSLGILFYKYNLMGTFVGVIIVHMINTMMFMVWLPANSFRAVHRQQEEAARDAGAGPFRTFIRITFPLAIPGIAVATIYTFLGSLQEAQGTLLVGMNRMQTMPLAMYGLILDGSRPLAAAVFGVMLIVPSLAMILGLRRYIGPEAIAGGFKMK